ncbi:MAG TPA: hypothetical protein VGI57_01615, partial [Usitatibacter sp.]
QGWPHVNHDQPLALEMSTEGLPRSSPFPKEAVRTEFDGSKLGPQWVHLRTPSTDRFSLTERRGFLRLKGNGETLDEVGSPAFIARRQEHFRMRVAAKLDFTPDAEDQFAGLVLRQNERNHYEIRVTGVKNRRVEVITRVLGESVKMYEELLPAGAVVLRIEAFPDGYSFGLAPDAGLFRSVARASSAPMASEKAGGFTGVFVGMYACCETGGTMPAADFAWFDYEPLDP